MNEPHDPNQTADIPSVPADSLEAVGTTAHVPDRDATGDHVPGLARPQVFRRAAPHGTGAAASSLPAVPGYRVLREIARGGMGRVLAAHDLTLDREVALKILLPGANADRFVRESKITARLPHPGISPVHALGTLADGSPFLAMKLIAGQTLADELKTADRPRLLQAFTQVCQAVGFAHSRGVIHRDLKPANVMVGAFGEVQVMDWGLAKEVEERPDSGERPGVSRPVEPPHTGGLTPRRSPDQTQAGAVLGTPQYMAPEQARGEATDARADVFALGAILCVVLTGAPPFGGRSTREVIRRAGAADLAEALARLDGCGADAEVVALCRRCLSPSPVDRPADGQVVADGLTAYLDGVQERLQAAERERAVAVVRASEQQKRRRVQLALAGAVALLLLGGGAFAWWQDRQANEATATEARLAGERDAEARNTARQAHQAVDANLKLATDLRKQYRFRAAAAALAQAAELATGGAPDRLAEVEQARRDLAFVVQLDDIRYRKWIWFNEKGGTGTFNLKIAPPEYRKAFAERGLDLTTLTPAEAATQIAASAVKDELIAAVDDWALYEPEPGLRNRLLDVARRADPGPWTDRLRDHAVRTEKVAVQKLAADADPTCTSSATLTVLAELMKRRGLNPAPLLLAARANYPTDFELAFALGLWHDFSKDGQQIGPYEAARALRPGNVAVSCNLGGALVLQGKLDEGITAFRTATRLQPDFAGAHNNLGFALGKQGKLDEAISEFRKAIRLQPDLAVAHDNLGGVFCDHFRDYPAAEREFRTAIRLKRDDASAHYNLGNALKSQGKFDEAITEYRAAIRLKPDLAEAHDNLGNALSVQGKLDQAITEYRTAIRLKPDHAFAHYNLGEALSGQGRHDEAITEYRTAIRLKPAWAEAHTNLASALVQQGKLGQAIAEYRTAIRLKPDYALAHGNLGIALAGQGKLDEAITEYRRAIRLNPNDALAHCNLGALFCDRLRDYPAAEREFRTAIRLKPNEAVAHTNLGEALRHQGKLDEAITEYRTAIRLKPDLAEVHTNLGSLLCDHLRDYPAAESEFRTAIRLQPDNVFARFNLSNALEGQGKLAEAVSALRRAAKLVPPSSPLAERIPGRIRELERQITLAQRLPAVLRGEDKPRDNAERMAFAQLAYDRKKFAAATRLWAEALASGPKLGDDRQTQPRYNAACAAALAAAGKSKDEPPLDDAAKAKLHRQAFDWLKAELTAWGKLLDSGPPQARPNIVKTLSQWQKDTDLAGIRDKAALAKLPADERAAFVKLWADVAALLKKAQNPTPEERRK